MARTACNGKATGDPDGGARRGCAVYLDRAARDRALGDHKPPLRPVVGPAEGVDVGGDGIGLINVHSHVFGGLRVSFRFRRRHGDGRIAGALAIVHRVERSLQVVIVPLYGTPAVIWARQSRVPARILARGQHVCIVGCLPDGTGQAERG